MRASWQLFAENRDFRRLFVASLVSLCGDWFSFVALADLLMELTGRPGSAAYIAAAIVIPIFLASPLAGFAADRFDRRIVLVIADLVRVPLALSLCLAAWWGSVWLALVATMLLGVGSSFHDPAMNAATPNLVDDEDLATGQALMGAAWGSMLLVGAGLGGLVAELFGRTVAFSIDALSFGVSALLIAGIRKPMQEANRAQREQQSTDIREALRYIKSDGIVARLVFAKVGVSSANGTVGLLPYFARSKFAGTNIATGILLSVRGLGAMMGPIFSRLAAGREPSVRAIAWICALSTLIYAGVYAAIPVAPWFVLACVLVILAHLGGGAQWALSTYGLQVATPDHLRGRVLSVDYGIATAAIGGSSVVTGVLADTYGADVSTWILSGFAAVYGVFWIVWSRGMLRRDAAARPGSDRG